MSGDADDIQVSQSLTEVLGRMDSRIDQGFGRIEAAVEKKASKHDLDTLTQTVTRGLDDHEKRLTRIEGGQRGWVNAGKVTGAILASAAAVAGIAYTVAYIAHP